MTSPGWSLALAACAALAAPLGAGALDAPHDASSGVDCLACHISHSGPGGALTTVSGNANLCASCHNTGATGAKLGFPFNAWDQAVPGSSGASHRWDALTTGRGARTPANAEMARRVTDGKLCCSVCHDQHQGASAHPAGSTIHVGLIGAPDTVNPGDPWTGGSGGTLAVPLPTGPVSPKGYLVEISSGGAVGVAQYRESNDGGVSWRGPFPTAATVALSDPGVRVSFGGTFATGDRWRFYVSYPMLRASNLDDAMCEDCHRDRVQGHADVEGTGAIAADGVNTFSHPVGEGLGANGKRYDLTSLRDVDGSDQSTGDGNPTNDLRLYGGRVRCTTCHAPHDADSNSLTTHLGR